MASATKEVNGSFRDPSGHVFMRDGTVYRQVNHAGRADYEFLMSSRLYDTLTAKSLLLTHEDLGRPAGAEPEAWTVLRPVQVPFVSYPHGWCFSQLKDAALATLSVQRHALAAGMSLKDANATNIQFVDGRPVLIDTLSFERLVPGPWVAYRQFCQHFLAPLALTGRTDERLGRLSQLFVDGIPLDLASRLLPRSTWLRPGMLLHLHLHAIGERRLATSSKSGRTAEAVRPSRVDAKAVLLESLEAAVRGQRYRPGGAWKDYYARRESYTIEAIDQKAALVAEWLDQGRPRMLWDLGANTGRFARLASHRPSPAMGWAHEERASLVQRGPADWVFALALVHHFAIASNVPLDRIARFMASIGRHLVIEFVPKDDPMARAMLATRADIFAGYDEKGFEAAFGRHFAIERRVTLRGSSRVLYWMRTR
ncbi:MAG: SAM-dependent methyltransferase [Acidobacteria bacterium]|nr:SAM-dependent methyltransferase [Acidobacteriota bacterium]